MLLFVCVKYASIYLFIVCMCVCDYVDLEKNPLIIIGIIISVIIAGIILIDIKTKPTGFVVCVEVSFGHHQHHHQHQHGVMGIVLRILLCCIRNLWDCLLSGMGHDSTVLTILTILTVLAILVIFSIVRNNWPAAILACRSIFLQSTE